MYSLRSSFFLSYPVKNLKFLVCLIAESAAQKEIAEGKFAVHLGERVQHVNIINEKDCIKIMLKGWLDKQVWKEINDILRVHQFAWLSNGKDSCWIRMMNGKE